MASCIAKSRSFDREVHLQANGTGFDRDDALCIRFRHSSNVNKLLSLSPQPTVVKVQKDISILGKGGGEGGIDRPRPSF